MFLGRPVPADSCTTSKNHLELFKKEKYMDFLYVVEKIYIYKQPIPLRAGKMLNLIKRQELLLVCISKGHMIYILEANQCILQINFDLFWMRVRLILSRC